MQSASRCLPALTLPAHIGLSLLFTGVAALGASHNALDFWPTFRGPLATGIAPNANPPIHWSETNQILWKVALPGRGSASPIVWGDRVFLLASVPTGKKVVPPTPPPAAAAPSTASAAPAPVSPNSSASNVSSESRAPSSASTSTSVSTPTPTPTPTNNTPDSSRRRGAGGGGGGGGGRGMVEQVTEEQRLAILAYERNTGTLLWEAHPRTLVPHEGHHKDHGFASASPVTDGEVLITFFGSRGLFAYSLDGKLLWEKDLGRMTTRGTFGEGSSPALAGDRLFIVWDHEGEDFILALDKLTGREIWRQKRDEDTNWTTPLVVEYSGRKQVIVNGGNSAKSYDFETGSVLWDISGQTKNVIPTPVADQDTVYLISGWRGAALQAVKFDGKGTLTGTSSVRWSYAKNTPYVPSPLLYGDQLYFFSNNNAQLSVLSTKDGSVLLDAERLEGLFGVYASPVGASDRIYLTGRNGAVWVVQKSSSLQVLAKNTLDDGFDASPALAGNQLFLRGRQSLYCIADKNP